MYKLVLFDLDGTILDTVPDIRAVLNDALTRFNLPEVDGEKVKEFVGNGAYMLVKRACGNADGELVEKVYRYYSERFAKCKNELSAYFPGERAALSKLVKRGVKLGIVTNKPHAATVNVYEKFFKSYNFSYVQGQAEGAPLKPSPECILKAAESCGVKGSECLFVGDGETDVQAAANAGVDCVSVLWGYRSRAQLEAAGAKRFAESYEKLLQIICENN